MNGKEYRRPDNFVPGRTYFYRNGTREDTQKYIAYTAVTMLFYRPHPAELVVELHGEKKLIHRRFLFSRGDNKSQDIAGDKFTNLGQ